MTTPKSFRQSRSPSVVEHPEVHPNAPVGGGGPGRFRTMKNPTSLGFVDVKANACYQGRSGGFVDPRYCEEVKPGTKEVITDQASSVRILVERQKNGLFHWLVETLDGKQSCEGVHDPETNFTAEMCKDITSKAIARELDKEVSVTKQQTTPKREIVLIVKGDWLTKISRDRWGTLNWKKHLKPTQETHDRRTQKGEKFNPDLIYPGDTFEITG